MTDTFSNSKQTPIALNKSLLPFGTSIFTSMTALANETGAVNLSQGFPDSDGPEEIKRIAAKAILTDSNQYAPSVGIKSLREAVAGKMNRFYNVQVSPDSEVTITHGATEGLAAALLGLINPGDEVILFEPFYDLYPAMVARAGGKAVYVALEAPDFLIDFTKLEAAFSGRTRAIVINNPQNPCGKVFAREELVKIGRLCQKYNAVAIGDEVYEHITYDGLMHTSLLMVKELKQRAVVVSSAAKTFSMTGWKVGYVVASERLTNGIRMAHQFLTYCTPSIFQKAIAEAIKMDDDYYKKLQTGYHEKRELFCGELADMGLDILPPQGAYYATLNITNTDFKDDIAFCKFLASEVGVAAIPESLFFNKRLKGTNLVRFCFCKRDETLLLAIEKLKRWFKP
jgi:N-succinyldiaminopimelate aminotransferase